MMKVFSVFLRYHSRKNSSKLPFTQPETMFFHNFFCSRRSSTLLITEPSVGDHGRYVCTARGVSGKPAAAHFDFRDFIVHSENSEATGTYTPYSAIRGLCSLYSLLFFFFSFLTKTFFFRMNAIDSQQEKYTINSYT